MLTSADRGVPSKQGGASTHYTALDGLRGYAILLVVVYHANCWAHYPTYKTEGTWPSPWMAIVEAGHTGVGLFFVLSGFLLSLPMLKRPRGGGGRRSTLAFYRRRMLRILPLYWSVMLVGAVLAAHTPSDLLRIAPYLVFANGLWPVGSVSPYTEVTWSLSTEVQFYLLLPLVFALAGPGAKWRSRALVTVSIASVYAALISGYLARWLGPIAWHLGRSVIGEAPLFLAGGLVAWLFVRHRDATSRWLQAPWLADLLLVLCIVALGFLLQPVVFYGYWGVQNPPWVAWHVAEAVLWGLVLLLVVAAPLRSRGLFTNRFMVRLGILSYSVYLIHWPILTHSGLLLHRLFAPTPGWNAVTTPWYLATFVVTLALSWVTYTVIERPFLARKARVGGGWTRLRMRGEMGAEAQRRGETR